MNQTTALELAHHFIFSVHRHYSDKAQQTAHYYMSGVAGSCPPWAVKYRTGADVVEEWRDAEARRMEASLTGREFLALADLYR